MKCMLAVPSWRTGESHKSFAKTAGCSAPLGPLYLASVLREEGHDVAFVDGGLASKEEVLKCILSYKPDILLLSFSAFLWKHAREVIREAKLQLPDLYVVAGGAGPSGLKEKCLQESPPLDCVAYGEGENTVREIASRIENGLSLEGVRGTIVREKGRIISNPSRPYIENLDEIPFPARDLISLNDYIPPVVTFKRLPTTSIITSRGCNMGCIYCFRWGGYKIRYRSVENVIAEIEECVGNGIKDMRIWDDNFASDRRRAVKICDEMIKREIDVPWIANLRVDTVDRELLKKMKKAGCWMVLYGVESGVQKNIDVLKKGIKLDQIREAFKAAHDEGVKTYATFMFGIPGETVEGGIKTIEFARALDPLYASFFTLSPFPGTVLYDEVEKYGRIEGESSDLSFQAAPFVPYSMSREDILYLRNLALKRFYIRPSYFLKRLSNIRSLDDIKVGLRGIQAFLKMYVRGHA